MIVASPDKLLSSGTLVEAKSILILLKVLHPSVYTYVLLNLLPRIVFILNIAHKIHIVRPSFNLALFKDATYRQVYKQRKTGKYCIHFSNWYTFSDMTSKSLNPSKISQHVKLLLSLVLSTLPLINYYVFYKQSNKIFPVKGWYVVKLT